MSSGGSIYHPRGVPLFKHLLKDILNQLTKWWGSIRPFHISLAFVSTPHLISFSSPHSWCYLQSCLYLSSLIARLWRRKKVTAFVASHSIKHSEIVVIVKAKCPLQPWGWGCCSLQCGCLQCYSLQSLTGTAKVTALDGAFANTNKRLLCIFSAMASFLKYES